MEKENLLRSKRIYEKRLSEELQLKTISNTRGHHYSANYREWLHKEIKAMEYIGEPLLEVCQLYI